MAMISELSLALLAMLQLLKADAASPSHSGTPAPDGGDGSVGATSPAKRLQRGMNIPWRPDIVLYQNIYASFSGELLPGHLPRSGGLRLPELAPLNATQSSSHADDSWHEAWWHDAWPDWHEAQHGQTETAPPPEDDPNDKDLQDSLQAEKEAEALALQAQRAQSEAQSATAMLKKDRRFGQHRPGHSGGVHCIKRGGNHMARDCTGRGFPSKGKHFGKGKTYVLV